MLFFFGFHILLLSHTGNTQGLLLALQSGITPGSAQGYLRIEPESAACKASTLTLWFQHPESLVLFCFWSHLEILRGYL